MSVRCELSLHLTLTFWHFWKMSPLYFFSAPSSVFYFVLSDLIFVFLLAILPLFCPPLSVFLLVSSSVSLKYQYSTWKFVEKMRTCWNGMNATAKHRSCINNTVSAPVSQIWWRTSMKLQRTRQTSADADDLVDWAGPRRSRNVSLRLCRPGISHITNNPRDFSTLQWPTESGWRVENLA